jgi:hypothetical protein
MGSENFLSGWVSCTFRGKASNVELICVIEWIKLHEVWWLWNFSSSVFYYFTVMITQNSLEYSPYTPTQRTVVAGSSVSPIGHEDSVWAVGKRPVSSSSDKWLICMLHTEGKLTVSRCLISNGVSKCWVLLSATASYWTRCWTTLISRPILTNHLPKIIFNSNFP